MTRIADLPEFHMAEWLPDEAAVAEYLTVVMEENDPAALAKALRDGASPRYETISRVLQALGVKLVAVPQGT
ncbi:MAG: hypothetical protein IPG98_07950 [Burkholderiales bacterium]|nr:hypothetical protein [Burkholderiales bacterium]MBK8665970.1 hypothetical protein [Burkholderiales bacterium]